MLKPGVSVEQPTTVLSQFDNFFDLQPTEYPVLPTAHIARLGPAIDCTKQTKEEEKVANTDSLVL
jgi:hypothetical protein